MNYGFLIDNKKCIGCHACSTVCKSENQIPIGVHRTWVKYTEVGQYPDVKRHFQVTRCNHCENPPCVSICPVTAMYQRDDGIVEFDKERCIGCKACIQACPYDAIHIDPESSTAAKCHYCAHRVEQGMEPACVVVCPEHAILAGDLDDPESEIAKTLANNPTTVRKPEQGTNPNLFYIDGEARSAEPGEGPGANEYMFSQNKTDQSIAKGKPTNDSQHMVQVGFNAQHKVYWKWPVPAYIVTKDIASGLIAILGILALVGTPVSKEVGLAASLTALLMMGLTAGFLVGDLTKPLRFLYILIYPQWKSWLTRGTICILLFSLVNLGWVFAQYASIELSKVFIGVTFVACLFNCAYTAFLFGQAEGRDLWQSPILPIQFVLRGFITGSASMLLIVPLFESNSAIVSNQVANFLFASLSVHIVLVVFGEVLMPHQTQTGKAGTEVMIRGALKKPFYSGMILTHAPLLLGFFGFGQNPLALIAVIVGVFLVEYAFVVAAQHVPNS